MRARFFEDIKNIRFSFPEKECHLKVNEIKFSIFSSIWFLFINIMIWLGFTHRRFSSRWKIRRNEKPQKLMSIEKLCAVGWAKRAIKSAEKCASGNICKMAFYENSWWNWNSSDNHRWYEYGLLKHSLVAVVGTSTSYWWTVKSTWACFPFSWYWKDLSLFRWGAK